MALSAFDDKNFMPDDEMVAKVLGDSFSYLETIRSHLAENYKNISEEWGFNKKGGWSKNIRNGKRSLFYITPMQGAMRLFFFLSDKQVAAANNSNLPKGIIERIPETRGCVCGYAFEMDIKTAEDARAIIKLIEIKDKN